MTYTTHRQTQQVLKKLQKIDLAKPNEEDFMAKFHLADKFKYGALTTWERLKPKIWGYFDAPYSSYVSKVIISLISPKICGVNIFVCSRLPK